MHQCMLHMHFSKGIEILPMVNLSLTLRHILSFLHTPERIQMHTNHTDHRPNTFACAESKQASFSLSARCFNSPDNACRLRNAKYERSRARCQAVMAALPGYNILSVTACCSTLHGNAVLHVARIAQVEQLNAL